MITRLPLAWVSGPTWTNLTGYTNSWATYASDTPGWWKDANGFVWLRGTITGGTLGATALTMPGGTRPGSSMLFHQNDSAGSRLRVDVAPTGAITPQSGSNAFVPLNGICYLVEA